MDWSRIPVASYVFFGLFLLASLVHLLFCYFEKEIARKATKCFTTLFLSIAAIICVPTEPLVYCGVLCGMFGDLCLLKKHKVWPFVLGMISFLAEHVLYIICYMKLLQPLHYGFYLTTAIYVVLFPIVFFRFVNKLIKHKKIAFGGTLYLGILLLDLIWAIIASFQGYGDYCYLCVLGMISFIVSDSFLARTLFKKDVRRRDFFIMLTYLLAQGLIVAGLCLTYLVR